MKLFPSSAQFFVMFDALASDLSHAGKMISHMMQKKSLQSTADAIRLRELSADELCHTLIAESEAIFITPIDREDIHVLAKTLDDIIDTIEDLGFKFVLYNGDLKPTKECKEGLSLIEQSTTHIAKLVNLLKYKEKHRKEMKTLIAAVHDIEYSGDQLFRRSIGSLFAKRSTAISIIKWKDIYETIESILDLSEKAADTIDVIMIKNF